MINFNFKDKATQQVLFVFGVRADTLEKADIINAIVKLKGDRKVIEEINEKVGSKDLNKDIQTINENIKTLVDVLDNKLYKKD